jgi:hypothetical protein
MDVLERLLFDLQSSIEQSDSVLEPSIIVNNIAAHAFSDELGAIDQEYISHLLLQSESPPSLLVFLRDSPHSKENKEIVKAKATALKFLAKYIKETEVIDQFAVHAFSAFYKCFVSDESNEVKTASLLPLKNIFRRCGQSQSDSGSSNSVRSKDSNDLSSVLLPDKVNLVATYELLFNELRTNKKITKGIRCELLKLLGLIVSAYPEHAHIKSRIGSLIDLCLFELKRNFSGGLKDPELTTIAGAFSCLDRCMFFPGSKAIFGSNTELWGYLLKATSAASSGDLTRFSMVCKALRLIKHHTNIFQSLIGKNASQTYKAVEQCHKTGKAAIVKHSEGALYAVLECVSAALIADPSSSEALLVLQTLFNNSLLVLISTGVSEKEVIVAVKGIAAVAPCMTLLDLSASKNVLSKVEKNSPLQVENEAGRVNNQMVIGVIYALMQAADRNAEDDEGSNTGEGVLQVKTSTAGRISLFLDAIASVINATRGSMCIPPNVMSYLQGSSVDLIVAYPRLQLKLQGTVQRALGLLLTGLAATPPQSLSGDIAQSTAVVAVRDRNSKTPQLTDSGQTPLCNISPLLKEYLDVIAPALLLRTVSRRAPSEEAVINQALLALLMDRLLGSGSLGGEDLGLGPFGNRLVPVYFPLWLEILNPGDGEIRDKKEARSIFIAVYDRMMLEVLRYLRGFDLSYVSGKALKKDVEKGYSHTDGSETQGIEDATVGTEVEEEVENEVTVVASNPADQDLLLSLVVFLELLLPCYATSRLTVWFPLLIVEVVQLCRCSPLVSPLYRLLLCLMDALAGLPSVSGSLELYCSNATPTAQYSTTTSSSSSSSASSFAAVATAPINGDSESQINLAVVTVRSLISAMQCSHVQHFHDELLSTALMMILRAPSVFVPLETLLDAVGLALKTGVQALSAVCALHKAVMRHTGADESSYLLDSYLGVLLPLLDSHLMVTGGEKKVGGEIALQTKGTGAGTVQMKKAKLLLRQRSDFDDGSALQSSPPADAEDSLSIKSGTSGLQRSIVRLLGSLGGRNQKLLLEPSLAVQAAVSWGGSDCITIPLPLSVPSTSSSNSRSGPGSVSGSGSKLLSIPLSLDKLLPRVVELCSPQGQLEGNEPSLPSLRSGKISTLILSLAEHRPFYTMHFSCI